MKLLYFCSKAYKFFYRFFFTVHSSLGKFWLRWSYSSLTHYEELNSPMCILCRALGQQSQKTPTPSSSICFRNVGIEIQLKGLTSPRFWKFFRDSPKRSDLCIFCNSKSWSLLNLALLLLPVKCYAILNLPTMILSLTSLWNRWELTLRVATKWRQAFFQHWREITEEHRILECWCLMHSAIAA